MCLLLAAAPSAMALASLVAPRRFASSWLLGKCFCRPDICLSPQKPSHLVSDRGGEAPLHRVFPAPLLLCLCSPVTQGPPSSGEELAVPPGLPPLAPDSTGRPMTFSPTQEC